MESGTIYIDDLPGPDGTSRSTFILTPTDPKLSKRVYEKLNNLGWRWACSGAQMTDSDFAIPNMRIRLRHGRSDVTHSVGEGFIDILLEVSFEEKSISSSLPNCMFTIPSWIKPQGHCPRCGGKLSAFLISVYCPKCD
jgi:hypothetical protein